jgi:hypothetical protein
MLADPALGGNTVCEPRATVTWQDRKRASFQDRPPAGDGNRPAQPWFPSKEVTGMRYRLVVRVTAADIGQRVTIRWRPAELDGSTLLTDVLGTLEDADDQLFKVRRDRDGQLVVIPRARAVAGKVVPPARPPRRPPKAPHLPDATPSAGDNLH